MCYLSRQTRTAMLDSINQEYIKTARAKGLKTVKLFQTCTEKCTDSGYHLSGTADCITLCGGMVVEQVFSIPGLGRISFRLSRTEIIR